MIGVLFHPAEIRWIGAISVGTLVLYVVQAAGAFH